MYRKLVRLHAFFGMLAAPLLLIYGATGLLIVHNIYMPTTTETRVVRVDDKQADDQAIEAALAAQGIIGAEMERKKTDEGLKLVLDSPATRYDVLIAGNVATVRLSHRNTVNILERLHHRSGFWNPQAGEDVWGIVVLLSAISCLALAISGLSMWWKRKRERTLGVVFLSLSSAYALSLLVIIRLG